MNVLWKCCIRSLKENKSRTIVTILGVALATALITAIGCMGTSFLKSEANYLKQKTDWHARYTAVSKENLKYFENNQSIESAWYVKRKGYGILKLEGHGLPYLEMLAPEKEFYQHNKITLTKGRLPEKEGEIIVSKNLRTSYGFDVKVGDEIQIDIGDRAIGDSLIELGTSTVNGRKNEEDNETLKIRETRTYKVVGLFQGGMSSSLMARRSGSGFSVIAAYCYDEDPGDTYDVYVRYTKDGLKNHTQVAGAILGASPELVSRLYIEKRNVSEEERLQTTRRAKDYSFNSLLAGLEYPGILMRDYYQSLGLVAIVYLFVIYAGVFCINNSFDLSFTERIRFYGMLSSVGTTKRQKRKIVWMEALYVGTIGIPIGVLVGCLLTFFLVGGVNVALSILQRNSDFHMVFQISIAGILISTFIAAFMVFLSAMESAVRASRIMPISAMRMNDFVKAEADRKSKKKAKNGKKEVPKRGKTPHLIQNVFGPCGSVAWKNIKRSKLKYRATITSIAISVALLIGISFIELIFEIYEEDEYYSRDIDTYWQVIVSSRESGSYERMKGTYDRICEVKDSPGVTKSMISASAFLTTEDGAIPYLDGIHLAYPNYVNIVALDEETFSELCKQVGIDPETAKGKGIVDTKVSETYDKKQGAYDRTADFINSNVKELKLNQVTYRAEDKQMITREAAVEIAGQKDQIKIHLNTETQCITIYVDWSWLQENDSISFSGIRGGFLCEDAIALENEIEDMELTDCYVYNVDYEMKSLQFTKILVLSFLGGFIGVIFLIGVTNVINAISTNMELRAPEYAKLKALGMTEGQFKGMLCAEGFFIAGKGLAYGLLIGYGISYALYRFFWEVDDKQFSFTWRIPVWETVAAIFAVAIMMWFVLKYGRKKLQKKNLIETIRGENI